MPLSRFIQLVIAFWLIFGTSLLFAQQIIIDESYTDWDSVPYINNEPEGDAGTGNIDILNAKVSSDTKYLYFYLEVDQEILLQDNQGLSLLIDTDNNSNTGESYQGLGYEFLYNLGERNGEYTGNSQANFNAYDVGLVSAPTVSSTKFEFKINRDAEINDASLFTADSISFLFRTQPSGGDVVPDAPSGFAYEFSNRIYEPKPYTLEKYNANDIRVLSYNVLRDNLFESEVSANFERIFKALNPDIIGLQEVYNHSGEEAAQLIGRFLPGEAEQTWHHGDVGNDNLIVSRYPVINQAAIQGNAAYLLEGDDSEIMVIVAHPPCCTNDSGRQEEFDAIMRFVRESKSGDEFNISENTPILIIGDMNLVGLNRQVSTLLTGDIAGEDRFGGDFDPDWDGSAFEDAKPENPQSPTTFTWFSEGSSFSAGRLDYIVYSGSVWELQNKFSLHTLALPEDSLNAYNLQQNDTKNASDHLPVVADFRPVVLTSMPENSENPSNIKLHQNYPNPFNPATTIRYSLSVQQKVKLEIFNINGQKLTTLLQGVQPAGQHTVKWEGANQASGVYFYRLSAGSDVETRKMILLK